MTISVALIAALSSIGVCERCKMQSGGVYFLVQHVLGARLGAAVGIIYCFGQVKHVGNKKFGEVSVAIWYQN